MVASSGRQRQNRPGGAPASGAWPAARRPPSAPAGPPAACPSWRSPWCPAPAAHCGHGATTASSDVERCAQAGRRNNLEQLAAWWDLSPKAAAKPLWGSAPDGVLEKQDRLRLRPHDAGVPQGVHHGADDGGVGLRARRLHRLQRRYRLAPLPPLRTQYAPRLCTSRSSCVMSLSEDPQLHALLWRITPTQQQPKGLAGPVLTGTAHNRPFCRRG
jgi:hypothetical protein